MINYAVVGAGWISQQAFLPGVGQSGNSRVAAIVTGDRAKAARLADFYGIDTVVGYDGYDALLKNPEIDAVYIALPNHMHADYAIRAARAGKHILVEKPLALSEDEALAMIAAARSANGFLMTVYRLHNEPGTVAVLEQIRANAIGRPLLFQSAFSFQTTLGNLTESDDLGRAAPGHRRLLRQRRPPHFRGRADRGHGDGAPARRRSALCRCGRFLVGLATFPVGRSRPIRRKLRGRIRGQVICTPILAIGEPSGPMLNGMTYMVRPRMQPSNNSSSVARIFAGAAQLLVGPASSWLNEQMKVRSSTRPTSEGCERARKELGRLCGLRRMNVPDSTIIAHSRSYSRSEPSTHCTRSGLHSRVISSTHADSCLLVMPSGAVPAASMTVSLAFWRHPPIISSRGNERNSSPRRLAATPISRATNSVRLPLVNAFDDPGPKTRPLGGWAQQC